MDGQHLNVDILNFCDSGTKLQTINNAAARCQSLRAVTHKALVETFHSIKLVHF
jgi:hypothetical protein